MRKSYAALCLFFVTGLPAQAQELYRHNGSVMKLKHFGSSISIFYEKPRKGLANIGVRSGALLFRGKLGAANYIQGMSRIFSPCCGEVDYYVYGDFKPGQKFTLRGAAPVLAKNNCRIINNIYKGSNANLVFTPIANRSPQKQVQNGVNIDGMACIINIRAGSTLNMRAGPSTQYGIVAEIPGSSCTVQIGKTCITDWCGVRHQEKVGWVNTRYLRRK